MPPVQNITRGPLFVQPINMTDAWIVSIIEQKFLIAAYDFHKLWTGAPEAASEVLHAVKVDFQDFAQDSFFGDYAVLFNILENRWEEIAGYYDQLNPLNFNAFVYEIVSDLRNTLFSHHAVSSNYFSSVLNLYHSAYSGYVDYYIDIYNVYLQEYSMIEGLDHASFFPRWFNYAHRPHEIHIVGNYHDHSMLSPAHWIELSQGPLPIEDVSRLMINLTKFSDVISGSLRDHVRLTLKKTILPNLVRMFRPSMHMGVLAYPMANLSVGLAVHCPLVPPCSSGQHKWAIISSYDCDEATCLLCGFTKDIVDFTDAEEEALLNDLESMALSEGF